METLYVWVQESGYYPVFYISAPSGLAHRLADEAAQSLVYVAVYVTISRTSNPCHYPETIVRRVK